MEERKTPWTIGYKDVKNFMHNELGITKEHMDEIITKIVRDEVSEAIGQNGEFIRQSIREIIRQEMIVVMNEGKYPKIRQSIWNYTKENQFKDYITDIIKEEIIDTLRNQFDFSFNFNKK